MKKSFQLISASTLSLAMIALSACGNGTYTQGGLVTGNHYSSGSFINTVNGADGSTQDGNFTCPANANVLPYGNSLDTTDGAADNFKVCPSSVNTTDIKVHGSTSKSAIICVFPIQVVDPSHAYTKPDTSTGMPWYQCAAASDSSGVTFSFTGVSWNASMIVEYPDVNSMQACLFQGNLNICPQFSYGQFR